MQDVQVKFDEINLNVEVAAAYANDGAPRTAADRLRKAAEILDQIAEPAISTWECWTHDTRPCHARPDCPRCKAHQKACAPHGA